MSVTSDLWGVFYAFLLKSATHAQILTSITADSWILIDIDQYLLALNINRWIPGMELIKEVVTEHKCVDVILHVIICFIH